MLHFSYMVGSLVAGTVLAVALVTIGLLRRRRLRDEVARAEPRIEDDDIDRIIRDGRLAKEDAPPLDLDEIAAEEERFWRSESWEEAEEF